MLVAVFLATLSSMEESYVEGAATRVSAQGIGLDNGRAYLFATEKPVICEEFDGASLSPSRVPVGSYVRLWLTPRSTVSRVFVFDKNGNVVKNAILNGAVVNANGWGIDESRNDFAGLRAANVYSAMGSSSKSIAFSNDGQDDYFECYIGTNGQAAMEDARIIVRVDGDQVYQSPTLTERTKPIKLTLPTKGKSLVTFESEFERNGSRVARYRVVSVADPVFFKVPDKVVKVISPNSDEPYSGQVSISWDSVQDSMGYIIECVPKKLNFSEKMVIQGGLFTTVSADKKEFSFDVSLWSQGNYAWRISAITNDGSIIAPGWWRTLTVKHK